MNCVQITIYTSQMLTTTFCFFLPCASIALPLSTFGTSFILLLARNEGDSSFTNSLIIQSKSIAMTSNIITLPFAMAKLV